MDTAQWPQETGLVQLMEGNSNSGAAVVDHQRNINDSNIISNKAISAAPRPQKPQAINCPRCNSTHTKFCYYNNYSLSQPRYFCKTCRRYWTEGGSLRSVPVGGGSRKNKRSSSSSSSLVLSKKLPVHETVSSHHQNPNIKIYHEGSTQDLNLAYPPMTNPSYTLGMPHEFAQFPNSTLSSQNNFSQFLKSGISGGRGFSSFMSMIPVSDSNGTGLLYSASTSGSSGLPFQEFSKTSTGLNFSLNQHQGFDDSGNQGGYGSTLQGVHQENSTNTNHPKLFNFPFEDLKQPDVVPTSGTANDEMNRHDEGADDHLQSSGLIWSNGELGGTGASW